MTKQHAPASLIVFSIGPVQDFIAAARRTRDLWFGSTLLSELSKAVAKGVAEAGGELVFPAVTHNEVSKTLAKDSDFNVANVILARLPEGAPPRECMEKGRKALYARWEDFTQEAKERITDKNPSVLRMEQWEKQADPEKVLEFFATWAEWDENTESFGAARKSVMRLLAARKGMRNFSQPFFEDEGLPKSSLDGFRPTVFSDMDEEERLELTLDLRTSLRLSKGEHLDAVGIVKRLGGEKTQLPLGLPHRRGHLGTKARKRASKNPRRS